MFPSLEDVKFTPEGIQFDNYPFSPASVAPSVLLPYGEIAEIDWENAPPELRTKKGEVLFIPAVQKEKLAAVAEEHSIPVVKRLDVWSCILETFLDSELTPEQEETTLVKLESSDISRELCDQWRVKVAKAMNRYNFDSGLWEAWHLGLYDLLLAVSSESAEEFSRIYWDTMEVAGRAILR